MKKIVFTLLVILNLTSIHAQVGIGTTTPDATSILDINANDKGVLVPRINLVDVTNLTTPINSPATGLLIWNTNAIVSGGNGTGFYFFNGAQWTPLTQVAMEDHDFYEEGTTNAPDDINNDIYTFGNVAIGKNNAVFNIDIVENANTRTINLDNTTTSGVISGIFNTVSGNMTTAEQQRGLYNLIAGTGNNTKTGVYNNITGSGSSSNRHGTYNSLSTNSDTSDHGTYNNITSSSISNNYGKYGTYNSINNGGTSDNYGVYNVLNGSSTRSQTGTFNWVINSSPSNSSSNYGVRNIMQLSGPGSQYGIHNDLSPASGTGLKIGIRNVIDSSNDAPRTGIINYFNGTGNGNHVGLSNSLLGSGTGNKTGISTYIDPASGGTHFGLYSTVSKAGSFSGYFIGDVAIGTLAYNVASPDYYILPSSRGTNNQIMQTDGSGNVNWVDPSTSFWSRTGTNLDVATAGDNISFSSDQTSITFPQTTGTPSPMVYMFDGGSSNSNRMVFSHSNTYTDWGLQYRDSDDSFRFLGGGTERVSINLGTGSPLIVNGNAEATSFISATTTYPDYVFEAYFDGVSKLKSSYTFKNLEEIENFIIKNRHLPGVSSYSAIAENSMTINLAETTLINLEKIEELFLYSIELKKENTKLKEHQKTLEKRLKKIEDLVLKMD
ncbi:autotransporter outer membrane beta-barrel domain-containing protein [Psychroserpens sp. MEBiC05023]